MERDLFHRLTFEWKILCLVCYLATWLSTAILANGMCSYVLSVYVPCALLAYTYSTFSAVRIGKQDHLWQPKVVWRTTFGCQKWSPGPVLVGKFGPARTTVGKGGRFLVHKP